MQCNPATLSLTLLALFALARVAAAQTPLVTTSPVPPLIFPVAQGAEWEDSFGAPRAGHTHQGQDLMAPKMRPLVACFAGTVTLHSNRGTAENWITLHGTGAATGWRAEYMHLNNDTPGTNDGAGGERYAFAPGLKNGDSVTAGQFLGYVGNSGNAESTGSHCHFELHGPGGVVNCAATLRTAKILPALQIAQIAAQDKGPLRIVGTVLAVFPGQGEAVIKAVSVAESVGDPRLLDPPRIKRLLFSDSEAFSTLAKGVLLCAEGKDSGPGKPLQVERLTTIIEVDAAADATDTATSIAGTAPGDAAFVLLPDGTRIEGTRLLTLEATGYGPGGNGKWGDRTSLGTKVGYGTVAVDPKIIPLRKHLWVEGYGFCIALDTGGAIKGMKIDLGHDTDTEALALGRKKRRVLILD